MSDSPPLEPAPEPARRTPIVWPWIMLTAGLLVVALFRVPLVLNARTHLDSDLAVDGITLDEALAGHWRWHYPGTPNVGTATLALLLPIGAVLGATTTALGVGGVLIYALSVVSTFLLALKVFGRGVAVWSLVPLVFASSGTIWLSGRITGGHLLTVAWHAIAFALLYANLTRGGPLRAAALGVWCGLGLWNDAMFAMTLVGLVPVGIAAWFRAGHRLRGVAMGLIVVAGTGVGLAPRYIGEWVDPYDAYNETFTPASNPMVLLGHLKMLGFDCLPRLLIGHRLPQFEAEPGGIWQDGQPLPGRPGMTFAAAAAFLLGFGLFVVAVPGLAVEEETAPTKVEEPELPPDTERPGPDYGRWAVRWGLLISMAAVLVGFVLNRNIFNSDNYRYLVLLLVPWSIGFGRLFDGWSRKGTIGAIMAGILSLAFAVVYTIDAVAWYRNIGWIDANGRVAVARIEDPVFNWIETHPDVNAISGGYWDVYRYAFLTGGRVKGVPTDFYPNRFPEWSDTLPGGRPAVFIARSSRGDLIMRGNIRRSGGSLLYQTSYGEIWSWPLPPGR